MPNTARPVATYLATCLREPLSKLGAQNLVLGVRIREQLVTIVRETSRLDQMPSYLRLGARIPIYEAISDLLAIVAAGRALGDFTNLDQLSVLDASSLLIEALNADREAEAAIRSEANEVVDPADTDLHLVPPPSPVMELPVLEETEPPPF